MYFGYFFKVLQVETYAAQLSLYVQNQEYDQISYINLYIVYSITTVLYKLDFSHKLSSNSFVLKSNNTHCFLTGKKENNYFLIITIAPMILYCIY